MKRIQGCTICVWGVLSVFILLERAKVGGSFMLKSLPARHICLCPSMAQSSQSISAKGTSVVVNKKLCIDNGVLEGMVNAFVARDGPEDVKSGMPKYYIETYGCQMNLADSDVVNSILMESGYAYISHPEKADVILINTCAIRENAESKIWQRLRYFNSFEKNRVKHRARQGGDVVMERDLCSKGQFTVEPKSTFPAKPVIGVLGCMAERLKVEEPQSEPEPEPEPKPEPEPEPEPEPKPEPEPEPELEM